MSRALASALAGLALAIMTIGASAAPSDPAGVSPSPDEPRLKQSARALVRISFIGWACPPFYAVDTARLGQIEGEMFTASVERFGKARLRSAMAAVTPEFKDALDAGGAAAWCPAQRAHFERLGLPGLIGEIRP